MKKNFILFSFFVKKHLLYKIKYIYLFELIHSFFNNNNCFIKLYSKKINRIDIKYTFSDP